MQWTSEKGYESSLASWTRIEKSDICGSSKKVSAAASKPKEDTPQVLALPPAYANPHIQSPNR
jgi:hypothetical protein